MRNLILSTLSTLALLIYPLSLSAQNSFSLSLDVDGAAGDQAVTSLNTSADQVIAIEIFGKDIQNASGVSIRFEYDASQVVYEGFDTGDVLPNAQSLIEQGASPTFVEISLVSFGGQATNNSGLVGTIRFRTTDAFSSTAIRLVRAELGRGGQIESMTIDVRVELTLQVLTPDFNRDGMVNFADFLAFGGQYGARQGDGRYDAKYDLDSDGAIGFGDFLIFSSSFDKDGTSSGGSGGGGSTTNVAIPDANLRAAIETALGKASGAPISRAEMAILTRLEAPNSNIKDLTGLEFATGLTRLDLGDERGEDRAYVNSNSILDVSPLAGLTNLALLDLANTGISDLKPLSGLINLTELHLGSSWRPANAGGFYNRNDISDISPLAGLTNLRYLNISGNDNLMDISPLAGLANLGNLSIFFTSISDLTPLAGLVNLTLLRLHDNLISEIIPLSGLTNLTLLYLGSNLISDISPLSSLTNLTYVGLGSNLISDIAPLSGLTSLRRLELHDNLISDLSPLVTNTGLGLGDTVYVRNNPLSATSINTHIPVLQGRGVNVQFGASKPAVEEIERGMIHEDWEARTSIRHPMGGHMGTAPTMPR